MLYNVCFNFQGTNLFYFLDTERFNRDYEDENFAAWYVDSIGQSPKGEMPFFFEIVVHKSKGELTTSGVVHCYLTEGDFEDDIESATIDVHFDVVNTSIECAYYLDDNTYLIGCHTYVGTIQYEDGEKVDTHMEVEYWEDEQSWHFNLVDNYGYAIPCSEYIPEHIKHKFYKFYPQIKI